MHDVDPSKEKNKQTNGKHSLLSSECLQNVESKYNTVVGNENYEVCGRQCLVALQSDYREVSRTDNSERSGIAD